MTGPLRSERVRVEGAVRFDAVVSRPDSPGAGLIVIHEWWGLNDDIAAICERFAGEGFLALAPDLYGGESTNDAGRAMELVQALRTADAVEIVTTASRWLAFDPECTGRVGETRPAFYELERLALRLADAQGQQQIWARPSCAEFAADRSRARPRICWWQLPALPAAEAPKGGHEGLAAICC